MCDYSLHGVKNRLATEGEQLFVNTFHTGSKGLASKADYEARRPVGIMRLLSFVGAVVSKVSFDLPAVCVPPGARLRLSGIPKGSQQEFGVSAIEEVVFTQRSPESFGYRDEFRFSNGESALIQLFHEGLRVEVMSLELEEKAGAVAVPVNQVERGMRANA